MGVTTNEVDVKSISSSRGNEAGSDDILDVQGFFDNVVLEYNKGNDGALSADMGLARSIVPAGTGALRDFSYRA